MPLLRNAGSTRRSRQKRGEEKVFFVLSFRRMLRALFKEGPQKHRPSIQFMGQKTFWLKDTFSILPLVSLSQRETTGKWQNVFDCI
jgi:hypothetical protein